MEVETAAGVVLVAGSVACAGAVVAGRPAPLARAGLAVALAIAAVGEFTRSDAAELTACAVAAAAIAALVLVRLGPVTRLSWLDAAMGASATAGLAVVLGADAAGAVGAGGVARGPGLGRRPPRPVVPPPPPRLPAPAPRPWVGFPARVAPRPPPRLRGA